jgi:hypothetical protein
LTLQAPVTEAPFVNGRLSLILLLLLSLGGAASPSRAAENPLQPFRQLNLPGGVASTATCINHADPADGGPTGGLLVLDTLPPGAAVQEAFLYWTVLSRVTPVPTGSPELDGMPLTPVPLGELAATPCFINQNHSAGFRADVTGLVTGNGSYQLSGFLGDGRRDGETLTEGASLFVIYCAPGQPDSSIVLWDGLDVINDTLAPFRQEIGGFLAAPTGPVQALLLAAAGNGQSRARPEDAGLDPFRFNGVDLDLTQTDILSGALCWGPDPETSGLYDHHRLDVAGLIDADATEARLEIEAAGDCYTIAAVAIVVDTIPGDATPEPSALDRNPAATPLLLAKTPPGLTLRWEDLGPGLIYHAYRGTLGAWYDHAEFGACDLGTPTIEFADEAGSHYFVAVTEGCGGAESTSGRDSFGAGRPSAADASGLACP